MMPFVSELAPNEDSRTSMDDAFCAVAVSSEICAIPIAKLLVGYLHICACTWGGTICKQFTQKRPHSRDNLHNLDIPAHL